MRICGKLKAGCYNILQNIETRKVSKTLRVLTF